MSTSNTRASYPHQGGISAEHRGSRGSICMLAGILLAGAQACVAETAPVTPDRVVTALEATFGVTPGERRNHTKGTCAEGEFIATPEAAAYSRSPLFSGRPIPVVARFSLAGGNPNIPDTARNPRGMALEFKLPGGGLQHMTMLNTPVFGAAHPQTFLDNIVAIKPDPSHRQARSGGARGVQGEPSRQPCTNPVSGRQQPTAELRKQRLFWNPYLQVRQPRQ